MSLLTMIQGVTRKIGVAVPTAIVTSTDEQILRLLSVANDEGKELAQRHDWQVLVNEATHTTLATESQGLITTIAGADFLHIIPDTVYNRSLSRQLMPVTPRQWQQMKSNNITGPNLYYLLRGNYLRILPTPAAGDTLAFEWASKNWCETSGGTGQSEWGADSDVGRLSEDIMGLGVVWRWKRINGFDYAQEFQSYETQVQQAIARDGVKPNLSLRGQTLSYGNNRNLPDGSFGL